MTTEQKAIAYDEAIERARKVHKYSSDLSEIKRMEDIFPELCEPDDEKIRKELINFLQLPHPQFVGERKQEKWISWLEKQGERESDIRYKYLDELLTADDIYQMSMNEAMTNEAKIKAVNALSNLCISNLLGLEKQGSNLVENGYTNNKDIIKYADNYSHAIWHKLMDNFKNIKDYHIGCNDVSDIVLNAIIDAYNWLEKQSNEPKWCHHKVDLSDCSEEYRKAYYDGWNNCNQQHSQCKSEGNDVVKCLINGMKFYYEDNEEATWGTEKFSMKVKDILAWLEKQGKETSEKEFTFKALPRLLEMIEVSDRAKAYTEKLAVALDNEAYHADAKIVRESIKIMNGEEVPMATMDEDERIRKELIFYLGDIPEDTELRNGVTNRDVLVWLEKQEGYEHIKKDWLEHIKQSWYKEGFIDGKYSGGASKEWTINDAATLKEIIDFLENGTAKLQHDLTRYANWLKIQFTPIEKQGEQKPINDTDEDIVEAVKDTSILDKVEPKFKVGDWITNGNYTWKIVEVKPLDYILQSQDGNVVDDTISHVDEQFHSFAIEDAKDGDVLYSLDSNRPFIYKERKGYEQARAYCGLNIYGKFFVWATEDCVITLDKYVPATKEQRDTLFAKMKEAGYEWDADKKELKKIEQKPTWSKDYELSYFESTLFTAFSDAWQSYLQGKEVNVKQWAKGHSKELLEAAKDELEKQKSAWSEEDEERLQACVDALQAKSIMGKVDTIHTNWLKSLKQRYTWKPSDEQITWLYRATDEAKKDSRMKQVLNNLLSDLKKLKGE